MSRFAVLGDDDDESSDVEPDTRQFTFQEILDLSSVSRDIPPPASLSAFPSVFLPDFQAPECSSFRPPSREINSQTTSESKPSRRPPARAAPRPAPSPAVVAVVPVAPVAPAVAKPAPERPDVGLCWEYRDPMDRTIGPFPAKRMREWLEKRVIDATLCVRRAGSDEKFQQIAAIFPDPAGAFLEQGAVRAGEEPQRTTLVAFELSDDEPVWETAAGK